MDSEDQMGEQKKVYENRDFLLGEIHEFTKNTEKTIETVNKWCVDHDKKDDKRFFYGALAILVVAFYAGVLPQVIKLLHIG